MLVGLRRGAADEYKSLTAAYANIEREVTSRMRQIKNDLSNMCAGNCVWILCVCVFAYNLSST